MKAYEDSRTSVVIWCPRHEANIARPQVIDNVLLRNIVVEESGAELFALFLHVATEVMYLLLHDTRIVTIGGLGMRDRCT